MRVNDLNLTGARATETGKAQGSQPVDRDGRSGASQARTAAADQIEFSPLSRALSSSAASRSARVEQLAAQYQAGQYHVDPVQVGQAIVSDALQASAAKL